VPAKLATTATKMNVQRRARAARLMTKRWWPRCVRS
jgi:hypothetical protein